MSEEQKLLDPMPVELAESSEASYGIDPCVLYRTRSIPSRPLRPGSDYNLTASGFSTRAVRTGHVRTFEAEHSEVIFETSSYVYESSCEGEGAFSGANGLNVYSRFTNPTVAIFERRLAALEGADEGVATASGMAAVLCTFMTLLRAGDHVICSRSLFGATTVLFREYLQKFNVDIDYVPLANTEAWSRAVRSNTRLMFCETPSNPLLEVGDLRALSAIARRAGAILVVDNTFCTPWGQTPIALGAQLVVHSAGKYIDGQGRCVGGAVVGHRPLTTKLRSFMRCAGPTLSPHNAWVFLKGLETLEIRMERASSSAMRLAEWLSGHPRVARVYYTGLRSHPQHALACQQQFCHGGVLSFEIHGERREAWNCIDSMKMISRTANVGDTKTMVTHPASTTHLSLSPEERRNAGVSESLVRLTIGLEDVYDIAADLDRGLSAV